MTTPAFNRIRQQATDLLANLTNARLANATRYPLDNNHPPDQLVELHAIEDGGTWHLDVLYGDGRAYDYTTDPPVTPHP